MYDVAHIFLRWLVYKFCVSDMAYGSRFFVRVKSWCDVIKILLLSLKVSFDSFVFWLLIKFASNSMYIFLYIFLKS